MLAFLIKITLANFTILALLPVGASPSLKLQILPRLDFAFSS